MREPILDRDQSVIEVNQDYQYASTSDLVSTLLSSSEFSTAYGTLTALEFTERMHQNSLGRAATVEEAEAWMKLVVSGTTQTAEAVTISESAEHIAVGNTHAITSNSLIVDVDDKTVFDTTVDKSVAGIEV